MSAHTVAMVTADDLARDYLALSTLMEFDAPIMVDAMGSARQIDYSEPGRPVAPEVWHDDADDVTGYDRDAWHLLAGYTGQHGYRGPVMHASEYIGGRMAEDILSTPGIYVAVVVNVLPSDGDESPEPAGWAVARWTGGEL